MLTAVICLAVLCVLTLSVLVTVTVLFVRHIAANESTVALERAELLNRIQRPDQIPVQPAGEFVTPEQDPDEIALVGQISFDPEYVGE